MKLFVRIHWLKVNCQPFSCLGNWKALSTQDWRRNMKQCPDRRVRQSKCSSPYMWSTIWFSLWLFCVSLWHIFFVAKVFYWLDIYRLSFLSSLAWLLASTCDNDQSLEAVLLIAMKKYVREIHRTTLLLAKLIFVGEETYGNAMSELVLWRTDFGQLQRRISTL